MYTLYILDPWSCLYHIRFKLFPSLLCDSSNMYHKINSEICYLHVNIFLYSTSSHDQNGASKEWRKRTLQCPHCGVTCMYQHTLSIHIERKHGSLKDDDGKRESYQCEECGKVFKYQVNFCHLVPLVVL